MDLRARKTWVQILAPPLKCPLAITLAFRNSLSLLFSSLRLPQRAVLGGWIGGETCYMGTYELVGAWTDFHLCLWFPQVQQLLQTNLPGMPLSFSIKRITKGTWHLTCLVAPGPPLLGLGATSQGSGWMFPCWWMRKKKSATVENLLGCTWSQSYRWWSIHRTRGFHCLVKVTMARVNPSLK